MRTKTPVRHRRRAVSPPPPSFFTIPILSTTQDEYNGTTFETSCESDDKQQFHVADCIHQDESIDLLDKNICICCNQGGGVLVCSQTACPVTLHVNCLDSEPKFDDFGNFYCPYCWYKRAVDKCQELREKTMTTKKALSSFLDKNGGSMMKEVVVGDGDNRHDATNGVHSQNLQERKKYVADQDSMNLEKFNKPDTSETRDTRNKDRKEIKDLGHNMEDGCERIVEVGEEVPVELLSGSSLGMCVGVQSQNVACDKGAEETVANLAEDKGIKDQGKLPRVEQKMSSTSSSMSEANDSDFEVVSLKKGHVKRKLPETAYPQKVAPVNKSLFKEHSTAEKIFKEHSTAEKNASNISEEVTSSRTLRQPHTSPNYVCSRNQSFLAGRRKPLCWTVEEETTLKEGVLKSSTKNEKVPWKRILEFGSRVFDKTRTPIDLKDKWRNITAKEGL